MKYKYLYMAAVVYFFSSCGSSDAKSIVPDDGGGSTTEKKQKISYADPTIFLDNGTYYMISPSYFTKEFDASLYNFLDLSRFSSDSSFIYSSAACMYVVLE